ncbi:hypothetical protein L917_13840 [Phytophthora nicotianae]|uniref:Uncharacterized protein n=1 Tax=Phytophthora nicotianae TaxID=4792 RepID=W2KR06_PHYNI|nr:hypothetical protein L915_14155 [Phytophthora nicotianae]ETL86785.1 hypothetical protein L917_13840 [Phytophthora nicotianae]
MESSADKSTDNASSHNILRTLLGIDPLIGNNNIMRLPSCVYKRTLLASIVPASTADKRHRLGPAELKVCTG